MTTPASCDRPPAGWECRLPAGHDGPCPTWRKGPSPARRAAARLAYYAAVLWLLFLPTWTTPHLSVRSLPGAAAVTGALAAVIVLAWHAPRLHDWTDRDDAERAAAAARVETDIARIDGARQGARAERIRVRAALAPLLAADDVPETAREHIVTALYTDTPPARHQIGDPR